MKTHSLTCEFCEKLLLDCRQHGRQSKLKEYYFNNSMS